MKNYFDGSILCATNESLCKYFSYMMQNEFKMSKMDELMYFFALKIHQTKDGPFINQDKYCKKLLKIFEIKKEKSISTPMSTSCNLGKGDGGKLVKENKN